MNLMAAPVTPVTYPQLGWRPLVGRFPNGFAFNYPHISFAVRKAEGRVHVYGYSSVTGATFYWPCSQEGRAVARVIDWARQGA